MGVVISDRQVSIFVTSKELNWFYKNNYLLLGGRKVNFVIERENKNMLQQNHKNYHQVVLTLESLKNHQENDSITLNIYKDSISLMQAFFNIWEGE